MKITIRPTLSMFRHQSPVTTGPALGVVSPTSTLAPKPVVTVATPNVVIRPSVTVNTPNPQPAAPTASKELQMASTPVVTEPTVEPTTATPAATTETAAQKVENFFTKFGTVLKNIVNVGVNVAEETEPTIDPLLPAAYQAGYLALINAAATQVAAADAKYALIGASNVSFATKVAEAVAVGGEGVLAIAAQNNLAISSNLTTFFSAAATLSQSLNVATLTQAPTVPAVK